MTQPAPLDPMQAVFRDLRLMDSRYVRSSLSAPWGMRIVGCGRAVFHFAARGGCHVLVDGAPVGRLDEGDLVLLPHGRTHALVDAPGSPVQQLSSLDREDVSVLGVRLRSPGADGATLLISGSFRFAPHPVVSELPDTLFPRRTTGGDRQTERLIATLLAEVDGARPGSEIVVDRLADVLVIWAIRSWLDAAPEGETGWVGALREPGLGRVLALIHTDAARDWTLETLAAEAGMSRSRFAARFRAHVGATPIRFLTGRRMQLATQWMRRDQLSIAEVSERLGYASVAAFSRAFKRHTGATPGQVARWRRATGSPWVTSET